MSLDTNELIDALENCGFDPEEYSGRAMFGAKCVSIRIEAEHELWDLAYNLADEGVKVPAPRIDTMGRGLVAYWPAAKWGGAA